MTTKPERGCGHTPSDPKVPEPLLSIEGVAEWLKLSKSTLYHLSSEGGGPRRVKIGGLLRYQRCCVMAWIDECRLDPEE